MTDKAILSEAYERFQRTGPEWGDDQLTNHGPMAVEVLVRRGHADAVSPWVARYVGRLDEMPAAGERITAQSWRSALGSGRIGDWAEFFEHEVTERPWRDVLVTWWPRLLPGFLAGATHGVIRVGHVVRALHAGAPADAVTLGELAHGLAFWAARSMPLPLQAFPVGGLDPGAALDQIPRIPSQQGNVATRLGQFHAVPDLAESFAALRPGGSLEEIRSRLADLVAAATLRYLTHGHGQPILLVHAATAPNAVLHTLPALPDKLWAPSLTAAWTASATLFAAYAPVAGIPRLELPAAPACPDVADDVVDQAVQHGDEHVIKFTDTAVEVFARTGQADALAAADHIRGLIQPVG